MNLFRESIEEEISCTIYISRTLRKFLDSIQDSHDVRLAPSHMGDPIPENSPHPIIFVEVSHQDLCFRNPIQ
jgi:hypothetical protein